MSKLSAEAKAELKQELLNCGEHVAKDAADTVFKMIEIVVKDTENKFDDTVLLVLPQIREYVNKLIDSISEEV